jgi:hypothetical protein
MEFFSETIAWLLGAYVAGSAATYYLFLKKNFLDATEATIDTLIANGFLRTKRGTDGEIEILKWNALDE